MRFFEATHAVVTVERMKLLGPVSRNSLLIITGIALWLVLVAVGTFVILKVTPFGQLLIDLETARSNPETVDKVLDGYRDPFKLFTETLPLVLLTIGLSASLLAGAFVGAFTPRRTIWRPILIAVPLAAISLWIDSSSLDAWLTASAYGTTAGLTALLVAWRRERRRIGPVS